MQNIIKRQEDCAAKNDIEGFIHLNREFHVTIDRVAKSTLLCTLLKDLRDLLDRYRSIIFRYSSMHPSLRDHKKLLELMKTRAFRRMQKLINKHIIRRKNLLKRKIRQGNRA